MARQASEAGHVDKEDVFASKLLEGDVLLPVDGEGSILEDGATHVVIAVRLEQKTRAREWLELEGNLDISMFKSMKSPKTTPSFGTGLEPRPNSSCRMAIMKHLIGWCVLGRPGEFRTRVITSQHTSVYKSLPGYEGDS